MDTLDKISYAVCLFMMATIIVGAIHFDRQDKIRAKSKNNAIRAGVWEEGLYGAEKSKTRK